MDSAVMEQRLKQWMPIFEEQAGSGLNKQDWCTANGIKRAAFFKWQRECQAYLLSKNSKNSIVASTKEQPAFVEIRCRQEAAEIVGTAPLTTSSPACSPMVISCNGFSVSISGSVDETNLAKVLKVISYAN